jgi:hypothetical protein
MSSKVYHLGNTKAIFIDSFLATTCKSRTQGTWQQGCADVLTVTESGLLVHCTVNPVAKSRFLVPSATILVKPNMLRLLRYRLTLDRKSAAEACGGTGSRDWSMMWRELYCIYIYWASRSWKSRDVRSPSRTIL